MIKECMDDGPEIPEQIIEVRKTLWSFQAAELSSFQGVLVDTGSRGF